MGMGYRLLDSWNQASLDKQMFTTLQWSASIPGNCRQSTNLGDMTTMAIMTHDDMIIQPEKSVQHRTAAVYPKPCALTTRNQISFLNCWVRGEVLLHVPQKNALRSSIGLLKKKTALRSCRHGRWYPSPRPGEWHQQTKLVSRCRWHKITTNLQGIFLILLLMDAWWLKRPKGNQWSKEPFYKEKHELSSNVTPKQASLSGGFGQTPGWRSLECGHPSPS